MNKNKVIDNFMPYLNATKALESNVHLIKNASHFTNWSGLEGIIRSQTLWLNHSSVLEDISEIIYGLEQIEYYVLSVTRDNLSIFFKDVFDDFKNFLKAINFYIASFCLLPDHLPAWRYYGDDGKGYAIIFKYKFFSTSTILPDASGLLFSRGKICYEIDSLIFPILDKLIKIVACEIKNKNAFGSSSMAEDERIKIGNRFCAALIPLIALIKNKDHYPEGEFRIYAFSLKNNNTQKISKKNSRRY